jgi:transposase-like protein
MVKNKAVYVALGVTRDEVREVLGLWPYGECRHSPTG